MHFVDILSYAFDSGVAVYVLGNRNGYGGVVQITIDGQSVRSVDLYGAVTCGEVLFSSTGLSNGQHTIKVELTGMSPNVRPTAGYPNGLFVLTNFVHVFLLSPVNCWILTSSMITDIQSN